MKTSLCMIGIDQWEEFTLPFIKTVQQFEPDVKLVVIDNESATPYPKEPYIKRIKRSGYAKAINVALKEMGDSDWYIVSNNDVVCTGRFVRKLSKMEDNTLWGMRTNHNAESGTYIEGWIFIISRRILDAVGVFDPKFLVAGYEDVDYSYRARKAGFGLGVTELPFKHLEAKTRDRVVDDYPKVRMKNREYYKEKHCLE